jgi:ABC-type bacteriocin/lantibiotic exporter with double-glycine peptidase domain
MKALGIIMNEQNNIAKTLKKNLSKQFYVNNKKLLVICVAVILVSSVASLAGQYLLKMAVDAASESDLGPLWTVLVLFAFIFPIHVITRSFELALPHRFVRRAAVQYKEFAVKEILKKDINAFTKEGIGTYLSALTNDISSIQSNYLIRVFTLIWLGALFAGTLGFMIYYSPILALVTVVLGIIPALISALTGKKLAMASKNLSDKNDNFVSLVGDLLAGFPVIKNFKAENEAFKQFQDSNDAVEATRYKRGVMKILAEVYGELGGNVLNYGTMFIGVYLAVTGFAGNTVTPGVLVFFLTLSQYVIMPAYYVPEILSERKAANALMEKMAGLLALNPQNEGTQRITALEDGITVSNLSFAYETDKPVLKDVSLNIEKGKAYAVVGNSGSGKSTLLNLLLGGYNEYGGSIMYDDKDLRTINVASLYDVVSLVKQEVFVFNASILDNITMFKDFDEASVDKAVAASGLSELVETRGKDFICGEGGQALSGGERQRLSIARSLLHGASVLLMDEAMASLDAIMAHDITSSILDMEGYTRVIVTHRLDENLLSRYDEVLVLRNGKLRERGSFQSLMEKKEYFYSLYTVSHDA